MTTAKLKQLFALLFAFALVAAACGGSDSEGASEEGSSESEEGSTEEESEDLGGVDADEADEALAEAAEGAEDADFVEPTTMEEWEILWAEERAAIVSMISENGYGLSEDGTTMTGPGGWEVDLSNCPADWNNMQGVSDGTINLGLIIAQSGTLAIYGNIATGMEVYFDYVNDNGGIGADGLQIALDTRDDGYDSALTQEYVEEFLGGEEPFAVQTLGTPPTFSVRDRLNGDCVPHPMALTGHPAWGDPVNYPWTTGLQLDYLTEGTLWASWIEQNLADQAPVTVAALVADNDFGLAYEEGFLAAANGSDVIGDVEVVRHDVAAATLTNEVTTLAAADPDVFIAMTAGAPCTIAYQEVARSGIAENAAALWSPSVCGSASLGPAEAASDGWLILAGGWKDPGDAVLRGEDVYMQFMYDTIEAAGVDPEASTLIGNGFGEFGWPHVEALKIAAELEGGVTRVNYLVALRSLDMHHPQLLPGISFAMSGLDDAFMVEGTQVNEWDSETASFSQLGGSIDLNGSAGTCAWDTANGGCG